MRRENKSFAEQCKEIVRLVKEIFPKGYPDMPKIKDRKDNVRGPTGPR